MIEIIKRLDLFAQYSVDELAVIEKYSTIRTFERDEIIAAQGETNNDLYIILSGKVVSTINLPGTIERKHGVYNAGDFFGEISVFGRKPLFDTYLAAEKSVLLIIREKGFTEFIETSPGCATRLISSLLSRTINQFRRTSSFLADVVQWGENASRRVITDEQTGVYNRAFLDDAMENFFSMSKSNSKSLSLLMLDLDNCRKINETVSHEAGNRIIIEFVEIIKRIISRHGIVARYGGDEFTILLPETDLFHAAEIAEEIRSTVETYDFSEHLGDSGIPVTVSIGISSFPETAGDLQTFKTRADESLYRAKQSGRNRVCAAE